MNHRELPPPPPPPPFLDAPALSLKGPTSSPGKDNTPTITASSVKEGYIVKLYKSEDCTGTAVGEGMVAAGKKEVDITVSAISEDGAVNYSAHAIRDSDTSPCSKKLEYVLDTVAPTAPTLALGTGLSATDNDTTPTLTASGVVSGDTLTLHKVSGCTDTALDMETASGTSVDLTPSTVLTDGSYTFYAKAEDTAGNSACSSTGVGYTLDISAVVIVLHSPSSSPGNDTTPTVRVRGLVAGDTVTLHKASGCTDTALATETVASNATSADLTPSTALTEATYTFYFKYGTGQSLTCPSNSVTYILDTTAPTAPTIAFATGTSTTDNDTTPTITASGVVSGDTITLHKLSGCTDTALDTVTADATTEDLTPSTALSEGTYIFHAKATDGAGNSACSGALIYSLDTTAPTAPTLALGSGLSAVDTDTTPTLTASGVVSGDTITLHKASGCRTRPWRR